MQMHAIIIGEAKYNWGLVTGGAGTWRGSNLERELPSDIPKAPP